MCTHNLEGKIILKLSPCAQQVRERNHERVVEHSLEFCGLGLPPIVLHTDADVARAFCHKRGVGRMKHLDVRHCWLHEELQHGNYSVKRLDRKLNASDMLTHSPAAEELRKFLPMIGCHAMTVMLVSERGNRLVCACLVLLSLSVLKVWENEANSMGVKGD